MNDSKGEKPIDYDPVFLNARREAIIIFCVWLVCLIWSVPFCYRFGYPDAFDPSQFATILGIPAWVFWGIAFPWLLADVVTIWFCFAYMKDDDLGHADDEVPHGHDAASPSSASQGEGGPE